MTATSAPARSPLALMARPLAFWTAGIAILLGAGFLRGFVPPAFGALVWGVGSSLLLLLLLRVFLQRDHRTWSDVGLGWDRGSVPRFSAGLCVGLCTYGLTLLLVSLVLGPIRLVPGTAPTAAPLILLLAGLLALAVMEELLFRSYALWTTLDALGAWPAQLVVALAFGLLHVAYGWAPATILLGVIPSAMLFGTAAVISRGLALPLGIHLGINLGRWLTGEAEGAGPWRLDLTAPAPVPTSNWAPILGALAPLSVGALLWAWHARRPVPANGGAPGA